ncbi:hypothetical protein O5O45_23765 [Hahella aquimaris]|uniref:hypothetical protein n=1 Tax=Hahella sp. HNIBRBA332 TaxID=3015983 RepID=UPI00273ACA14|nr:hypothetical protein [Hahella sp. HNIBRBA332]WLQ12749.1 hypothetical protein O5O45_23765 [Hahella sp. HNIBRBA332]
MQKPILISALAATLLLAGCASTGGKRDLSQSLYLRGQFAWWDALDEYKVKKAGPDLYVASVELKADGQPYELKFGDAAWSAGTNCGFLSQEDQMLEFGKKSKANCSSVFENFKFNPPETGVYSFYLDNSGEQPVVYVEPAK